MGSSTTFKSVSTRTANRRQMLGGALAATATSIGLVSTARAQATPVATPIVFVGDGRYLLVADRSQTANSFDSIPVLSLADPIENVGFGTRAGTFLLPDGKLLFADTLNSAIVGLSSPDAGVPVVDATVPYLLSEILAGTDIYTTAITADSTYASFW